MYHCGCGVRGVCDGNSLPRESQVTWKWDAFPWGFGKIGVSWKSGQIKVSRSVTIGSILHGHLESLWKLTKTTVSSDFSKSIKSGLKVKQQYGSEVNHDVRTPMYELHRTPRPGGVEVRRPPLGGKSEGSIPVVLGFFLRSV